MMASGYKKTRPRSKIRRRAKAIRSLCAAVEARPDPLHKYTNYNYFGTGMMLI